MTARAVYVKQNKIRISSVTFFSTQLPNIFLKWDFACF